MSTPVIGVTAYSLAETWLGEREMPGRLSNPQIMAMLTQDASWPTDDETPWCSAFVGYVCKIMGLPRSKSLRARSWLQVGRPVELTDAVKGFDVVVFSRGSGAQPGPGVIDAPGHVGFFAETHTTLGVVLVTVLGGNQDDSVSLRDYTASRVLGVRRLLP